MEEYKILSNQILQRVEFQQKLLNYQLLAAGLIATIGIGLFIETESSVTMSSKSNIVTSTMSARYFLLLSPMLFFFLSWSFSNHDIMIVSLARYINKDLRPRIRDITGDKDVLHFEDFLQNERRFRAEHFGRLPVLGEEYLLPLVFPIILLGLYLYFFLFDDLLNVLRHKEKILIYVAQFALFTVDAAFLLLTIRLKIKAGKNYLRVLD